MGSVIELCGSCGFDIPADADGCPTCAPAPPPSLAALQVAGLALPTRSVHRLPAIRPRRDRTPRPLGRSRAARSAFSFTTALVLITFTAGGLAWLADRPRFVLGVPSGVSALLEDITWVAGVASLAAFAIGLVATIVWCVRSTSSILRARSQRRLA